MQEYCLRKKIFQRSLVYVTSRQLAIACSFYVAHCPVFIFKQQFENTYTYKYKYARNHQTLHLFFKINYTKRLKNFSQKHYEYIMFVVKYNEHAALVCMYVLFHFIDIIN